MVCCSWCVALDSQGAEQGGLLLGSVEDKGGWLLWSVLGLCPCVCLGQTISLAELFLELGLCSCFSPSAGRGSEPAGCWFGELCLVFLERADQGKDWLHLPAVLTAALPQQSFKGLINKCS